MGRRCTRPRKRLVGGEQPVFGRHRRRRRRRPFGFSLEATKKYDNIYGDTRCVAAADAVNGHHIFERGRANDCMPPRNYHI